MEHGVEMESLLAGIAQAGPAEIRRILEAVMQRYRGLFPDYDICYLALPRGADREQVARGVLEFLEETD